MKKVRTLLAVSIVTFVCLCGSVLAAGTVKVRHLHLVDAAYACLTHVGLQAQRAQGQNDTKKVLHLEPISQLKDRMRRIIWQETIQDVVKHSHEKPVIRRLEKLLAA